MKQHYNPYVNTNLPTKAIIENRLTNTEIDYELDNKLRYIRNLYPDGGYVVVIRAISND